MVRHFVSLKARLTWNGVRSDLQRRFGFPAATLLLTWLGFYMARSHYQNALLLQATNTAALTEYLAWVSLIFFAAWITLPVVIFPLDENLDPQQLAVLPIAPNRMIAGLAAASLVAPAAVVPLQALVANGVLLRGGWWMVLPASIVFIGLLVVGAQLFSAAISAVLRSRRGRDIATFLVMAIAGASFFAYRSISGALHHYGLAGAVLAFPISDWAVLIPPVSAQQALVEAASGQVATALFYLVIASGWLGVFALLWKRLLGWMLTTPKEGSRPARRSRSRGLATGPWGVIPALTRKELRFYVRDPRQRLVWTGTVIFVGLAFAGVIMGATGLYDLRGDVWAPLVAPVLVLFVGLPIALNLFGWERNAASYLFVLPARPSQLLLGKNTAVAIGLATETTLMALGLSLFTGQWRWTWLVFPLMVAAIGSQLAVGNVVSVLTPLRLPREGTDIFAQSTEQGCLAIVSQTVSFFAIGLLLVPPAGLVVLTVDFGQVIPSWLTALIAVAWGATLYGISLFVSSRLLNRRLPEVMAWVEIN